MPPISERVTAIETKLDFIIQAIEKNNKTTKFLERYAYILLGISLAFQFFVSKML
jgi:hypothetical protein